MEALLAIAQKAQLYPSWAQAFVTEIAKFLQNLKKSRKRVSKEEHFLLTTCFSIRKLK